MRDVLNNEQFTPFGLWIRQYLKDSRDGLSVTNLDYILEDFKRKKVMLLEEKQNAGAIHKAQLLTFKVIDFALTKRAEKHGYDYWGFYLLVLKKGATMPGPGMTLNGKIITSEQLQSHLNFEIKFCEPFVFSYTNGQSTT